MLATFVNRRPRLPRSLRWAAIPGILIACLLASPAAAAADPVDVNTATAEELAATMTGVGLKKAKAIVTDREENGPFPSIEDLVRVRGIGDATVDSNRDRITVVNPPADPAARASG